MAQALKTPNRLTKVSIAALIAVGRRRLIRQVGKRMLTNIIRKL